MSGIVDSGRQSGHGNIDANDPYRRFATRLRCSAEDAECSYPGGGSGGTSNVTLRFKLLANIPFQRYGHRWCGVPDKVERPSMLHLAAGNEEGFPFP